jgi:peptidoglycan/xylan/chitin deacetylase (PgdA/CDA1 family)
VHDHGRDGDGLIPPAVRARDLTGYGQEPPAFEWPDGARVVINLVLVYEEGSEYSVLWGDGRNDGWGEQPDPGVLPPQRDRGTESHYDYGSRAGVWRLARIFDAAGVPVTISAAAVALELNPPVVDWIRRRGHDVLGHGWRWLEHWEQTREEEREHLRRAIASYERTLGFRPLGWNCRSWPSEATRELLIEEGGFLYDSDGYGDDVPYYTTSGEHRFLIVPYSKVFNDGHYLGAPGYSSPDDLLRTLIRGLDELAGEDRVSMMTAAFHARWSGYPGRASVVREFIDHARRTPGVTFMRRDDIARWWHERYRDTVSVQGGQT